MAGAVRGSGGGGGWECGGGLCFLFISEFLSVINLGHFSKANEAICYSRVVPPTLCVEIGAAIGVAHLSLSPPSELSLWASLISQKLVGPKFTNSKHVH